MTDSNDHMPEPAPSGGEAGPVQAVIRKFGGIRPMAGKLEIAFTTVQGWKQRGHIPPSHHRRILDAAAAHGIALAPDQLGPDQPAPTVADAKPALPPPAPAAAHRGTAAVAGAIAAIAVAVALAALAALTAPQWSAWLADRSPDTGPLEARIATLERASDRAAAAATARADRLAALEDRVERLPKGAAELADSVRALVAARQATDRRLDSLAATLAIVETRLTDLGARVEAAEAAAELGPKATRRTEQTLAALDGRLGALERSREAFGFESRLVALEQRAATIAAAPDAAVLVVAVAQLRAALAGSGPFGAELAGVRAIVGEDPESTAHLAVLAARAEVGVPTVAVLESSFGAVATKAVRAAGGPQGGDWFASSIRRLQGLLLWRRTGERAAQAGGVESLLAGAEAALGDGNLEAALQKLKGLDGIAAEAAADWLDDARARLAADRAVAALTDRAIAVLKNRG